MKVDSDHVMKTIQESLESKTFEIGEFTKTLIENESDSVSYTYIGKKVISKIIEIINDTEFMW